jgi:RNA polymerase sigma-70 factor, ECF subfamily
MDHPSDIRELLDQIARGHGDAFRSIVKAYNLPLRSYLSSQIYHMEDADDLAQEIFIAVFRSLDKYEPDKDFRAWLYGIARNKVLNYFRAHGRQQNALLQFRATVTEVIQENLDNAAKPETSSRIEMLLQCVGLLPDKLKRVIRSGLDGVKTAELASELSISHRAVYQLHYRALQLLRQCITKEVKQMPLSFGGFAGPEASRATFLGMLDDIRIYNRLLRPDEIAALATNR